MSSPNSYVDRREWEDGRHDDLADQGVTHQKMREDWRSELRLELRSFKNEVRVLLVVAVLILKFNLPSELTAGAVALVGVKSLLGFIRAH